METKYDALVLGGGIAGLTYALKVAEHGTVGLVTKEEPPTRTRPGPRRYRRRHGPERHIRRARRGHRIAGDGLNERDVVEICVKEGPERLVASSPAVWSLPAVMMNLDLTREGGHSAKRIVHAKDMTGIAVQRALVAAAKAHPNICIFEGHHAVDLLTRRRLASGDDRCLGAYVFDKSSKEITLLGRSVMLAPAALGRSPHTSNPDVATGDVAMAWRAGAAIANLEFFQFHPTALQPPGEEFPGHGGLPWRGRGLEAP